MRSIAFILESAVVRDLLAHLGEPITSPTIAPARGPPLWEMPQAGHRAIDPQAQPAPDYDFDQRICLAVTRPRAPPRRVAGAARACRRQPGRLRPTYSRKRHERAMASAKTRRLPQTSAG